MRKESVKRELVLGTAQLGSDYGIANTLGKPDQSIVTEIVRNAWEHRIVEFDTAQAYGNSERVLGIAFNELNISQKVKVISKLQLNLDCSSSNDVLQTIDRSINDLGVEHLYALLLHQENDLEKWDNGLKDILQKCVQEGRVLKCGVSVYSPGKALRALKTEGIEIVQLPTNILDRRFEKAGVFELADQLGKQIYIRSIFLQGLLMMDIKDIPDRMQYTVEILTRFEELCREEKIKKEEIIFGYMHEEFPYAKIVVGVDSPDQIEENFYSFQKKISEKKSNRIKEIFSEVDEKILNPVLWP